MTPPPSSEEVDSNQGLPTLPDVTPPKANTTLTISGRLKQPEIVLFAEPTEKNSRVLVMKVKS